jgi:hypothetical protein
MQIIVVLVGIMSMIDLGNANLQDIGGGGGISDGEQLCLSCDESDVVPHEFQEEVLQLRLVMESIMTGNKNYTFKFKRINRALMCEELMRLNDVVKYIKIPNYENLGYILEKNIVCLFQ